MIPLLVAFLGAAFGTYFAIVKSKKERIWQERYETLSGLVEILETIRGEYEAAHMESMGVSVRSLPEKESVSSLLIESKVKLSGKIAKIQLLFKRTDIEALLASHVKLNSAFQDLLNLQLPGNVSDFLEEVSRCADALLTDTIDLAQAKCL